MPDGLIKNDMSQSDCLYDDIDVYGYGPSGEALDASLIDADERFYLFGNGDSINIKKGDTFICLDRYSQYYTLKGVVTGIGVKKVQCLIDDDTTMMDPRDLLIDGKDMRNIRPNGAKDDSQSVQDHLISYYVNPDSFYEVKWLENF